MKNVADDLRKTVEFVLPILEKFSDEEAAFKPLPQMVEKRDFGTFN